MLLQKFRVTTLSIDDVAWLLGTDVATIQRWVNSGILKCQTAAHGEKLFLREEVASLLANLGA